MISGAIYFNIDSKLGAHWEQLVEAGGFMCGCQKLTCVNAPTLITLMIYLYLCPFHTFLLCISEIQVKLAYMRVVYRVHVNP